MREVSTTRGLAPVAEVEALAARYGYRPSPL
jgi:hypothetical protein